MKEIQDLINSIKHDKSMGAFYFSSGNTVEGIKEAIVRCKIDKLAIENDLFYCHEKEKKHFFQELRGQVYNELLYRYNFSDKSKKKIFKKLVKECVIDELVFYIQDKKQTFFDMGKLVSKMLENGFDMNEHRYIKIKNLVLDYEIENERNHFFGTLQKFKKWLERYIPCSINNIKIKKSKDKYIVRSDYLISIPYIPTSIKGLEVELQRIDTEHHRWEKNYKFIYYKEKSLIKVERELSRLFSLLKNKTDNKGEYTPT